MKWIIASLVIYAAVLVMTEVAKNAVIKACGQGNQEACHVLSSNR